MLKEGEAGVPFAEPCREHGISNARYYLWKSKYSGLQVSELQRLRELEAENAKLSITRACQIATLSRAAYYKRPMSASERDAQVIDALNAIVTRHGRWRFWECFTRLRLDGRGWNKKRVHRV